MHEASSYWCTVSVLDTELPHAVVRAAVFAACREVTSPMLLALCPFALVSPAAKQLKRVSQIVKK